MAFFDRNPSNELQNEIPESFFCPMTLEIMEDPVMTRLGSNFERKAIIEWINRGNITCPLTRQPLSYSKLIPNSALRKQIEEWKQAHGFDIVQQEKIEIEDSMIFYLVETDQKRHSMIAADHALEHAINNLHIIESGRGLIPLFGKVKFLRRSRNARSA